MNTQTLCLYNLTKQFAREQQAIFHNVSFKFHSDKSYALMGPSGVGKSTVIAILAGIEPVSSGQVFFQEACISNLPFEQRMQLLQKKIGVIFQQPCLIAELTVLENVMLKAVIDQSVTEKEKERAWYLLAEIGLSDKSHQFPHQLSGGQQQRVALLRAIFYPPAFLLADEPTGSLDTHTADVIIKLLLMYHKKYAMGLIVSTHDRTVAQQCDVVLEIVDQNLCVVR
jgi:putative ABC transport system ATP-binding protein